MVSPRLSRDVIQVDGSAVEYAAPFFPAVWPVTQAEYWIMSQDF